MPKLTPEEYKLLDRMNKRLATWENNDLTNDITNQVRVELLNFYTKHDIEYKGATVKFKKSNLYTDEEKREILAIARAMEYTKSSSIKYYKSNPNKQSHNYLQSYETVRNMGVYGVKTFQDYIRFIDDIKSAKANKDLIRNLDSKQIARLYAYGHERDLTTEQINQLIIDNVTEYRDGSKLERFLMDEIEQYETPITTKKRKRIKK